MIALVIAAIVLLLAIAIAVGVKVSDEFTGAVWPIVAIGVVASGLIVVASSVVMVPARHVGVLANFGAVQDDTLNPGLHFIAPWTKKTDIDATIQVEEYKGDDCIYVKIADGGSACITLAYRWKINSENANQVYSDYNNSEVAKEEGINGALKKAIVSTNIKAAINEVLGDYDPLAGTANLTNASPEEIANVRVNVVPDYEQINADVKSNLEGKIGDLGGLVDIESVTISYVKLPDSTQKKIDAYTAAVQETKIAIQRQATAAAEAAANRELSASISNDPNVLVSKCLDFLADAQESAYALPAGFQCWPGGGSAVVVPSAANQ